MQKSLGGQIVIPPKLPSVIPIVAPNENGEQVEQKTTKVVLKPSLKGSINGKRLCRNVIIHGYCKFEGKGCDFNHDSNKPTSPQTSPENGNNKLPGIQAVSSVTADSVNAPEFVPRFTIDSSASTTTEISTSVPVKVSTTTTATETTLLNNHSSPSSMSSLTNNFSQFGVSNHVNFSQPQQQQQLQQSQAQSPPSHMLQGLGILPPSQMDPFYFMNSPSVYPRQPLQHHLYSSTSSHVNNLLPHQKLIQSFFIPDSLRQQLLQRNEAQLMTAPAHDLGLPLEVHVYHSLYPLDSPVQDDKPESYFYGHPSSVYKATCSVDGRNYVLLRIEGYRLANEHVMAPVEQWRRIRHCNVVSVREAFTTRAFGDASLIFVFDYHPCSTTLYSTYLTTQQDVHKNNMNHSRLIPERILWSYISQISSALKVIHGSGLAAGNIDPSKILMTGKNRLRLMETSVLDVLQYENNARSPNNIPKQQQDDLVSFGKLILTLASSHLFSQQRQQQLDFSVSFEYIGRYYSNGLKNLILYLLSKPSPTKSIDEAIVMICPYVLQEIDNCHFYNDELESELSRELENGRLVRLMSKMGFINERPEFDMDPSWSETGDRYLIKLFRDYVFHQVDENGLPVVDMAHVLTCLNKLDAGVEEKIMLMSRDEQSCLIVSFKEIKNCVISAFNDLCSGRK